MSSDDQIIVETRDLTRRFGTLTAVDRLSIRIERGEIFGLVGPDGAGKTTTLRLLCGLLNPTEGQAWVAGQDVQRNLNAIKDRIGYMAQRFGLYVDLTVEENMRFYADLFGISRSARTALTAQLRIPGSWEGVALTRNPYLDLRRMQLCFAPCTLS